MDNPKLFVLALETFGRRGKEFTAFLKLMAKTGEQTGYGEKWKFWQREVPKINAMLMLGNFNKAIAVRAHVMADLADRQVPACGLSVKVHIDCGSLVGLIPICIFFMHTVI